MPNLYGAVEISQFTLFKQTPCTKKYISACMGNISKVRYNTRGEKLPNYQKWLLFVPNSGRMGGEEEQILKVR